MKKLLAIIVAMLSMTVTLLTSETIMGPYKIGDKGPAGGIVFYDKGDTNGGWEYLEAAPSDQSKDVPWNNGKNVKVKKEMAIGEGKGNTEALIAGQGTGTYAAQVCKNFSLNGFKDWFLPSKDELNAMYLQRKIIGGFTGGAYWSSSQLFWDNYSDTAWFQNFTSGKQSDQDADSPFNVRAIRRF